MAKFLIDNFCNSSCNSSSFVLTEAIELSKEVINVSGTITGSISLFEASAEQKSPFDELHSSDTSSLQAWLLIGTAHFYGKALTPARKTFERVLQSIDRHNTFALNAIGCIYIELSRHERQKVNTVLYFRKPNRLEKPQSFSSKFSV